MAERRCDLCGGASMLRESAFIVRCRDCSLVATDPQPGARELQGRYGDDYYAGWDGSGGRARLWAARLALVRRFISSGRLLDVGCGSGEFLRAARGAGFEVAGTEFSAAARARIKDAAVYERPSLAPGTWNALTMWHVLEHTPSPKAALEEARAKLVPGGWLFVAVPNVDARWFDRVYRCVKGKPNELYSPETKEPHLFHFSSATLRRYLEEASLTVVFQGLDAPYYADRRKLLVDLPARAWFHLTGINRALTHAFVARKKA